MPSPLSGRFLSLTYFRPTGGKGSPTGHSDFSVLTCRWGQAPVPVVASPVPQTLSTLANSLTVTSAPGCPLSITFRPCFGPAHLVCSRPPSWLSGAGKVPSRPPVTLILVSLQRGESSVCGPRPLVRGLSAAHWPHSLSGASQAWLSPSAADRLGSPQSSPILPFFPQAGPQAGPLASTPPPGSSGDRSPSTFIFWPLFPCSVLFLQLPLLSWEDTWPPSLQPWLLASTSPLPAPSECPPHRGSPLLSH